MGTHEGEWTPWGLSGTCICLSHLRVDSAGDLQQKLASFAVDLHVCLPQDVEKLKEKVQVGARGAEAQLLHMPPPHQ